MAPSVGEGGEDADGAAADATAAAAAAAGVPIRTPCMRHSVHHMPLHHASQLSSVPCCPASSEAEGAAIPHRLQKRRAVNLWGFFVFLFFIGAFCFYVYIRATKTLGLGSMLWWVGGGAAERGGDGGKVSPEAHLQRCQCVVLLVPTRRYGILVLSVEVLGGLAMLPYGLCLTACVTNGTAPPPDEKGQLRTALPYHIRVVVPCYREPLDVIQKTVTAALVAPIPANCLRTGEQRLGVGSTPS